MRYIDDVSEQFTAYFQGIDSFNCGLCHYDNPYKDDEWEQEQWDAGWWKSYSENKVVIV